MALEPRFNFDFNTTAIDNAANMKAQRQMQNIASKESQRSTVGDFIKVAGEGAKVYNSIQAAEAISQSAEIDEEYHQMNIDLVGATETQKFERKEKFLKDNIKKGGAYQIAAEARIAPTLDRQYQRAKAESVQSGVALSYTAFQTYMQTPIDVTDSKGVVTVMTNREAGKTVKDFNDEYVGFFSFLEGSRPDINLMIAAGQHKDLLANIEDSKTPEELRASIADGKDAAIDLADNTMFLSKKKKVKTAYKQAEKQKDRAISAKNKEFKAAALTRIELSKDTANPNSLQKYIAPPQKEEFVVAHGDKADQEYQKYLHNFEEHETARDFAETYNTETDTDQNGLSTLQKTVANEAITYSLTGALEGGHFYVQAKIILNQGSTDVSRLDGITQAIKSNLGNKDETADTLKQLMVLRSTNPAAFNTLFSSAKERMQILGMNALSQTLGKTPYETWMYMKTNPQITAEKLDSNTMGELLKIYEGDEPIPMKADVQAMYKLSTGYGVAHDDIMVVIKDYIKSKPYELNLEEEFGSDVARYMQEDVDKFSSLNGASKVFVDPVTGVIKVEGPAGTITKMIDKQGLLLHSMQLEKIAKYNDEHWVRLALEQKMDTASTWVGRFFGQTKQSNADEEAQRAANRVSNFVSLKDGKGKEPILNKPGVMDKINRFTPVKRNDKSPRITKEYFGPNFIKNLKNTDWTIKDKKVQKNGPYIKGKGEK